MKELYKEWYTYLYLVGLDITNDKHLIEEKINDTLIIYTKSYDSSRSKPITFLTNIMINNINYYYLRKKNKKIILIDNYHEDCEEMCWGNDTVDVVDREKKLTIIKNNLYILGDEDRELFNKFYFELYSLEELSIYSELNINTIKSKLERAKKKIKKHIENN